MGRKALPRRALALVIRRVFLIRNAVRRVPLLVWPILVSVLIVGAGVLGYLGFRDALASVESTAPPSEAVYRTLQLFVLNYTPLCTPTGEEVHPTGMLWTAHFLAATVALSMATLIILRSVVGALGAAWRGVEFASCGDHVIVCGLSEKGITLVEDLRNGATGDGEHDVVVIEEDPRHRCLARCRDAGAFVVVGDARHEETLKRAGIARSRYLVATCGDDGTNLAIACRVRRLMRPEGDGDPAKTGRSCTVPAVHIHVGSPEIDDSLQDMTRMGALEGRLGVRAFNMFETTARRLLQDHPPDVHADARGAERPHAVLHGFGRMGQALALELIRFRYLNGRGGPGRPPRLTIVDANAKKKVAHFRSRLPGIGDTCEIVVLEESDLRLGPETPWTGRMIRRLSAAEPPTAYYVCCDTEDDKENLAIAYSLRAASLQNGGGNAPVFVRTYRDEPLGLLGADPFASRASSADDCSVGAGWIRSGIFPYGKRGVVCGEDALLGREREDVAKRAHKEYLRQLKKVKFDTEDRPVSQEWDALPDPIRESNRRQADHVSVKLRGIGYRWIRRGGAPAEGSSSKGRKRDEPLSLAGAFNQDDIHRLAVLEHERWWVNKQLEGWFTGRVRRDLAKRHPRMIPFGDLDEFDQWLDRVHVASIPSIVRALRGSRICHVTTVGIVGHQKFARDEGEVLADVQKHFEKKFEEDDERHFRFLSALAPGADRLAIEAAYRAACTVAGRRAADGRDGKTELRKLFSLTVMLPLPFETIPKEEIGGMGAPASDPNARLTFTRLLGLAEHVLEMPLPAYGIYGLAVDENAKDALYERAGRWVVERSDTLLTFVDPGRAPDSPISHRILTAIGGDGRVSDDTLPPHARSELRTVERIDFTVT